MVERSDAARASACAQATRGLVGVAAACAVAIVLALLLPPAAAAPASAAAGEPYVAPGAVPTADDPVLEARMLAITGELRCLVCQNQTIADSHADLAVDLREETRELIKRGLSDDQIRRYMTDRYGDFILYRPPLKAATLVLWLGPVLLLALAVAALILVISRRAKLADDRFEADPDWDDDELTPPGSRSMPTPLPTPLPTSAHPKVNT